MSFVKGHLKRARDAISKKEFNVAKEVAQQVLEHEPTNYNAIVFLGVSLLELREHEACERTYRKAIELQPDQILAWQGIIKFYERIENWDQCSASVEQLMLLYHKQSDSEKCAETYQKLLDLRRRHGSRPQLVDTLSLLLDDSPIHLTLSALPPPDFTNPTASNLIVTQELIHNTFLVLQEIIDLLEGIESERFKKEVETRRTRLGALPLDRLKLNVGREIWGQSKLPKLYFDVINHPSTNDELRRETEAKLLRYKQRHLQSIPNTRESATLKIQLRKEVDEIISGMIILKIPDEVAWMTFLNGMDHGDLEDYNRNDLGAFVTLFPDSPLTHLLRGYCACMDLPWFVTSSEDGNSIQLPPAEAGLDMVIIAQASVPESLIANRAVVDLYLREEDYTNVIKSAEMSLEILSREEEKNGRTLTLVRNGFKAAWATALVHLFPPKHHPRALSLIEEVLSTDPNNINCLLGRAYVLEAGKNWSDAAILFDKVDQLHSQDFGQGLRAREEAAWCRLQIGEIRIAVTVLQGVLDILRGFKDQQLNIARCLWRIGQCFWKLDGEGDKEEAYRHYVMSLKANPAFAPSYTALGIYYSDLSSPPDPKRASKCFQKAFELDAREVDSARRLALSFADDREWDLVEVVARRTIEGEGGLNAGLGIRNETRYLPTNAWAWKALGVAELNRGDCGPAIQAFQIALRADPKDQSSWIRLGEAYGRGGRHAAALKTLKHAQELDPEDWRPAYVLGNLYQQMGLFWDGIESYNLVLAQRPTDASALIGQATCYLAAGRAELSEGFYARAETSILGSIGVAMKAMKESARFRGVIWKILADCMFFLSKRSAWIHNVEVRAAFAGALSLLNGYSSDRITDIMPFWPGVDGEEVNESTSIEAVVVAYDYRLSLGGTEGIVRGSIWYDLGVSLQAYASKRLFVGDNIPKILERSAQFLKDAIRQEPGNDRFWSALADSYFLSDAQAAQHSYVKALEIDPKNTVTWTKLGLLYLHYGDLELANQTFNRVQTLDAEYTLAWLGQALVAIAHGYDADATILLEHAVTLTMSVPLADLEFATRKFAAAKLVPYGHQIQLDNMLPLFFVLNRYCEYKPSDASALHLLGLVYECLGKVEQGVTVMQEAIALLETAYEVTEDPEVERRFTLATLNLARLRLASGEFSLAIESYESVLGLLGEGEEAQTAQLQAQAQLGLGVTSFMQGGLQESLGHFEKAIALSANTPSMQDQAVVLLAQVMWAIGTDESREAAQSRLLECITTNPENLMAINALAGMGILTSDEALVDAALSEILALAPMKRRELDPMRDVDYLLVQHQLEKSDVPKAISIARKAVEEEPDRLDIRNTLARLFIQNGQDQAALEVLDKANLDSKNSKSDVDIALVLQSVALSRSGSDKIAAIRAAQKAIIRSPSNIHHWYALAHARSWVH